MHAEDDPTPGTLPLADTNCEACFARLGMQPPSAPWDEMHRPESSQKCGVSERYGCGHFRPAFLLFLLHLDTDRPRL